MSELSERLRELAARERAIVRLETETALLAAAGEIDRLEAAATEGWRTVDDRLDAALSSASSLAEHLREIADLLGNCTNDETVGAAGDAWIKALAALAAYEAVREARP